MSYTEREAIDMLDRLVNERVVSGAELLRGTIALALRARSADPRLLEDTIRLLLDLEALILGEIVGFDVSSMDRVVRVAAALGDASDSESAPSALH